MLFHLEHIATGSQAQLECFLDEGGEVRVLPAQMIVGNVISLQMVRRAIEHFEESQQDEELST